MSPGFINAHGNSTCPILEPPKIATSFSGLKSAPYFQNKIFAAASLNAGNPEIVNTYEFADPSPILRALNNIICVGLSGFPLLTKINNINPFTYFLLTFGN